MRQPLTMKDLPDSERPYELLESKGAENLTDAQLLAILIRSGTKDVSALELAQQVLSSRDSSFASDPLAGFFQLPFSRLMAYEGIGRVKAIQIKAVAELSRRLSERCAKTKFNVKEPKTVASLFIQEAASSREEHVWYVLVDTKLQLLHKCELSRGGIHQVILDARTVFLDGYERGAYGFFLLHNHPSGDPSPSENDDQITGNVKQQGELMMMPLLDHIILGDKTFYSYARQDIFPFADINFESERNL